MSFMKVSLWHLAFHGKEKSFLVAMCCNFTGEFELRKDQPHTNIQYIIASAISDTNTNANNNICLKLAPPWTLGGTNRYLAELAKEIRATCVSDAKGVRRCVCCSISRSVYGALRVPIHHQMPPLYPKWMLQPRVCNFTVLFTRQFVFAAVPATPHCVYASWAVAGHFAPDIFRPPCAFVAADAALYANIVNGLGVLVLFFVA